MNGVEDNSTVEQEICVTCGFCCDGTLFNRATVEKREKEFLPEKMQERYFRTEKGEWFYQPCPYFYKKCTIYNQKKAHVCSSFRCQLLKNLSKQIINQIDALFIVKNAHILRDEIIQLYQTNCETELKLSFRELLFVLRKKNEVNIAENIKDKQLKLLLFKSNIFEILLIKHFKPTKEFENLTMD